VLWRAVRRVIGRFRICGGLRCSVCAGEGFRTVQVCVWGSLGVGLGRRRLVHLRVGNIGRRVLQFRLRQIACEGRSLGRDDFGISGRKVTRLR